jgi:hypothetical protein
MGFKIPESFKTRGSVNRKKLEELEAKPTVAKARAQEQGH